MIFSSLTITIYLPMMVMLEYHESELWESRTDLTRSITEHFLNNISSFFMLLPHHPEYHFSTLILYFSHQKVKINSDTNNTSRNLTKNYLVMNNANIKQFKRPIKLELEFCNGRWIFTFEHNDDIQHSLIYFVDQV